MSFEFTFPRQINFPGRLTVLIPDMQCKKVMITKPILAGPFFKENLPTDTFLAEIRGLNALKDTEAAGSTSGSPESRWFWSWGGFLVLIGSSWKHSPIIAQPF